MALATGSGLGMFAPKYQNETYNREEARRSGVQNAAYLSQMDTVYAQVDEQARQFDESMALKESQFGRKLEYEYDALEKQAAHWDAQTALGWGGVRAQEAATRAQSAASERQYKLGQDELSFRSEQEDNKMTMARESNKLLSQKYDVMSAAYNKSQQPTQPGVKKPATDAQGAPIKATQQAISSGEVETSSYKPPSYKQYNYSNSDPWVSGGLGSQGDYNQAMSNAPDDW